MGSILDRVKFLRPSFGDLGAVHHQHLDSTSHAAPYCIAMCLGNVYIIPDENHAIPDIDFDLLRRRSCRSVRGLLKRISFSAVSMDMQMEALIGRTASREYSESIHF